MRPLQPGATGQGAPRPPVSHGEGMEEKKKRRSGPSGPSGKHANPIRGLSGIPEDRWEAYGEHAKSMGISRMEWIRAALEEALSRQRTRLKKSVE